MSGVSKDAVAHRRRFPRRRQCGASLFGRGECCTSRRRQKEEDSETTLSSSRNPKMDLLAAAKMKTTATVTLFLTFLIAVGCSSAERNSKSRVGTDLKVDDLEVDAQELPRSRVDELLEVEAQELLGSRACERLEACLEARASDRVGCAIAVRPGPSRLASFGPIGATIDVASFGPTTTTVGLGVGKLAFAKVDPIYIYRGDLESMIRRYNDDDVDVDVDDVDVGFTVVEHNMDMDMDTCTRKGLNCSNCKARKDCKGRRTCKVLLRGGVCNELRGVTARGGVCANLRYPLNEKITIIGKVIGKVVCAKPSISGTIVYGDCISGTIVSVFEDDLSIIMNKDELNKDELELFGEYIAIEGKIALLDHRPGVLVSRVYLIERSSSLNVNVNAYAYEASGEATGSLWIRVGIFSLTVLLAAAVALIFWNLQKKQRPATKKLYIPKN